VNFTFSSRRTLPRLPALGARIVVAVDLRPLHAALQPCLEILPAPETAVFGLLSALRAHTKAPYKTDFQRKTLMALNRPRDGADSAAAAQVDTPQL
jgi:hypothetical protein